MKKIVIGILVTVCLFSMTGCGKTNDKQNLENNGLQSNTNEDVIKNQEVGNLKFTNTSLVMQDGISKLTVSVTNDTDEDIAVEMFDIYVKDADGNTIVTLQGYVGGVVPKHTTREVVTNCTLDLSNAANIEYSMRQA